MISNASITICTSYFTKTPEIAEHFFTVVVRHVSITCPPSGGDAAVCIFAFFPTISLQVLRAALPDARPGVRFNARLDAGVDLMYLHALADAMREDVPRRSRLYLCRCPC